MEALIQYLEESINDNAFSRGDKRSFKQMLKEHSPTKHDLDFIRSKVFDLANSRANPDNYELVIGWLEEINKTLLPQVQSSDSGQVYFSPGNACLEAILLQLRSAVSTARICVFTISDDRISREIVAAHNRGVAVKVLTDNDKLYDQGSDIRKMATAGVDIKIDNTSNHMHHKFAVFDKENLLTGSYNWTRSAANYNHENLLLTTEKVVVDSYLKQFDRLWTEMAFYQG